MQYAWLLILLPLAMSAYLGLRGTEIDDDAAENERLVGWLATGALLASFAVAVFAKLHMLFLPLPRGAERLGQIVVEGPAWITVGEQSVGFNLLLDPLSITMALVVTGVGTLIHWFARGYMEGDPHYPRFFALLNLFVAAMLALVLGSNLLFTFLGWEGVGFCSYMLIGYYTHKDSANQAGKKAFIVNRIGDLCFLLAMFLAWKTVGSLEYSDINAAAGGLTKGIAAGIALLLFGGAIGKSAQFPLYVWLPDAMEGPTPVSALIHAATMVTAGVYLVCRLSLLFVQSHAVMTAVATIGLLTAVLAALVAIVQTDIKRVLAYSTVSQLGFMFLAAGVGAFTAAIFHLITHAFFKALLFLGSGSVIHGMEHAIHHAERDDDPQDLRNMGGLAKTMPTTCATMIIGSLAIAGFPLLAGFWSKDEILHHTGDHNMVFMIIGLGVSLLTAFYMFRMIFLAFFQEPKLPAAVSDHVTESSATMTLPLTILAGLSVVGGLLNVPGDSALSLLLHRWLHSSVGAASGIAAEGIVATSPVPNMIISSIIALVGIGTAYSMYYLRRGQGAAVAAKHPEVYRTLANKFWLDEFYQQYIIGPGTRFSEWCARQFDLGVIDAVVNGTAAWFWSLGERVTTYQPGLVRSYALWFTAGAVGVVGFAALAALGPGAAVIAVLLVLLLVAALAYVARGEGEA